MNLNETSGEDGKVAAQKHPSASDTFGYEMGIGGAMILTVIVLTWCTIYNYIQSRRAEQDFNAVVDSILASHTLTQDQTRADLGALPVSPIVAKRMLDELRANQRNTGQTKANILRGARG